MRIPLKCIFLCAIMMTVCDFSACAQKQKSYTCEIDGLQRQYIMHIPENIKSKAPLVFALHGYGGNNEPAQFGLDSVANKYGFAVCYPLGIKDSRGNNCWNVGYPFQADMTIDEVKTMCEWAKIVQKKFDLSEENTFCCGMSNGGEMCYLLAYSNQTTFAAVAPVAGLTMLWMYQKLDAKRAIPLFEIHGTEDRISEWTGDLDDKGGWGAYMPVPIAVNYWVAKNRCTNEIVGELPIKNKENGHHVITHKFVNGIGNNEVWLYEVVGGSHAWGEQDLDTGEELWKFFSKFLK